MDEIIEEAIKPIVQYFTNIQTDILIKLIEHFKLNEEFINSDYWRVKKLEELGVFNKEVVNYIARATKKTPEMIEECLNKIGIKTISKYKGHIFDEQLLADEESLINNEVLKIIIDKAYNETSKRFIQMSSRIKQSSLQAYLDIVEEGYLKTSLGTHSYDESIRESIRKLASEGIHVVDYTYTDKKGNSKIRSYDITSTTRREILTASRQVSANFNMELIEKSEAEYIYLSEHLDCRPQHFDWQGTVIKKEDLVDVTDYGSVTGIYGINCRHYFEPYFGDIDDVKKKYTEDECNKRYYETQQQRRLERTYRKWKLEGVLLEKADGEPEQIDYCYNKAKKYQKEIIKYTNKHNLQRDFTREYIGR